MAPLHGNRWEAARWRRPTPAALSLIVVLFPLPLAALLAVYTGVDAVALTGTIASVLVAWGVLRLRGETWADLGLARGPKIGRAVAIAIPIVLVLFVLTALGGSLLARTLGWTPDISRFEMLRGNVWALIAGLLVVWTVAAFGEELLFRGYLLHVTHDILAARASTATGAWVPSLAGTSLLFGVAHAYQGPAGIVLTGLVGLAYGLLYLVRQRDLWTVIFAHGLYDTVGFIVVFMSWDRPSALSVVMQFR